MTANAFVCARVDKTVTDEAAKILLEKGLTLSEIIRMTLAFIAKQRALPFEHISG